MRSHPNVTTRLQSCLLAKSSRPIRFGLSRFPGAFNRIIGLTGYKLVKDVPYTHLHEYSSYEEYAEIRKFHKRRKLDKVFADTSTHKSILEVIKSRIPQPNGTTLLGICYGARNGYEVKYFNDTLPFSSVIGTDISDTSHNFENIVVWDFHDENHEWTGSMDFVYTNSLDQSWRPYDAIDTWLKQLKPNGLLFIEHTRKHGVVAACEMDPFGFLPEFMPYLLCERFGNRIALETIKSTKSNLKGIDAWIFVVRKCIV